MEFKKIDKGIEILRPNHAGCFIRKDSKPNDPAINYGVINIDNEVMTYWTQKAMLQLKVDGTIRYKDEKYLIENGYIETISLKDIERVLF